MTPFRLKIVAPDKLFFDGETQQVIARTTEGDVGILANHTKYVANLPAGPLKIKQEDGQYKIAAISSGILSVADNVVSILITTAEWADEIDIERAKRAEEKARQRLNSDLQKKDMDRATLKLQRALNRLSVAQK